MYDKKNYTANISYLSNTLIYEYDISKANISVLFPKGVLSEEDYNLLYNSQRKIRESYIGNLQKDPRVNEILAEGIIEAKKQLFESNNIQDYEVLSIKNDAIFIINRRLQNTKFGLIDFKNKNTYTAFYKIYNLELYYLYDQFSKKEFIDVKGINNNLLPLHENYMLQFLKDIFYTVQVNGVEVALRIVKDFYLSYISLNLPIGYYRKFNEQSMFHIMPSKNIGTGFNIESIEEKYKSILDISYNLGVVIELQKILNSMYFVKNR